MAVLEHHVVVGLSEEEKQHIHAQCSTFSKNPSETDPRIFQAYV